MPPLFSTWPFDIRSKKSNKRAMEKVAKLPLVIATYLVEEGNNVETNKTDKNN